MKILKHIEQTLYISYKNRNVVQISDFIWQTFYRLITELDTTQTRRFLYEVNLEDRLTGIIGPRGVGKTTLLLQLIHDQL